MTSLRSASNIARHVNRSLLLCAALVGGTLVVLGLATQAFGIDYQAVFVKALILLNSRLDVIVTLLVAIPVVLAIETLVPAKPQQKRLTVSFGHDLAWFFVAKGFRVTVIVWFIYVLTWIHETYFSYLTFPGVAAWPFAARFIFGFLLVDFLSWFHHFVRHKVRLLWHFHTIHHSQQNLNLFTDFRFHPFEYFVSAVITTVPLLVLGLTVPTIVAVKVLTMFQTNLYHGNVRLNFGPLRYVLVTPQSHRIHHSREQEHHDKNFGVVFCIWDRMFGTHYEAGDEYPDTGIADKDFPLESQPGIRALVYTLSAQLIYPFRTIYREFRERRRSA